MSGMIEGMFVFATIKIKGVLVCAHFQRLCLASLRCELVREFLNVGSTLLFSRIKFRKNRSKMTSYTVADPGGGSGVRPTHPPISDLTLTALRLKFLHQQDRISLFNWLIF